MPSRLISVEPDCSTERCKGNTEGSPENNLSDPVTTDPARVRFWRTSRSQDHTPTPRNRGVKI